MTKELLVMRHAKSSWELGYTSDHQRPLNDRGRRDAPRMAQWLVERNQVPQFIFSSTAVRAVETTQLIIAQFPLFDDGHILYCEELYHGHPNHYLNRLASLEQQGVDRVMVVGHNPGLEQLVLQLAGGHYEMPTAAIACLHFDTEDWQEIGRQRGRLEGFGKPKEI